MTTTGVEGRYLDPCKPGPDEGEEHRRAMLFFRDAPGMVDPDKSVTLRVVLRRRARVQLDELAHHRGTRPGRLAARIIERELRRYLRTLEAD